ncbi:MAG TPA: Na+/H+ antiporter [Gammaproteobacteria bacterium]|nr:Na+/H+ antiporter [Gammaproteobacteria bacterium]
MTGQWDFLIFGLLAAVAGFVTLARYIRAPYPVVLVLGGLALGFIPIMPEATLPPGLVLLVFLPPILYSAAFFASPQELKKNLTAIASLGGGVTLITGVIVAWVSHLAIGLPWAAAFVLGAIVAPTDPITINAIADRLGVPRQIITILEGESLINDGVALVLYHVALGVAFSGHFSAGGAVLTFVLYVVGGIAIGLIIGWIVRQIRRRVNDRFVEITISLLTSYAAYIPANKLNVSGVLAAVAAGLYLGWYSPEMSGPRSRLQMFEVWEVLPFLLNSLLFLLIGLQLPGILHAIEGYSMPLLLRDAGLIVLAVIAARALSAFPLAYIPRLFSRRAREGEAYGSWQRVTVVAYAGMRGGISLALALAVPLTIADGSAFPGRNVMLFVTFCVILITMVPQGLTLPLLARGLKLTGSHAADEREEAEARLRTAEAALARIEELASEEWVTEETAETLRQVYERRRRRFAARFEEEAGDDEIDYEERSKASQRLQREVLQAERETLLRLRNEGRITDGVRRRVERDVDLEDTRLGG